MVRKKKSNCKRNVFILFSLLILIGLIWFAVVQDFTYSTTRIDYQFASDTYELKFFNGDTGRSVMPTMYAQNNRIIPEGAIIIPYNWAEIGHITMAVMYNTHLDFDATKPSVVKVYSRGVIHNPTTSDSGYFNGNEQRFYVTIETKNPTKWYGFDALIENESEYMGEKLTAEGETTHYYACVVGLAEDIPTNTSSDKYECLYSGDYFLTCDYDADVETCMNSEQKQVYYWFKMIPSNPYGNDYYRFSYMTGDFHVPIYNPILSQSEMSIPLWDSGGNWNNIDDVGFRYVYLGLKNGTKVVNPIEVLLKENWVEPVSQPVYTSSGGGGGSSYTIFEEEIEPEEINITENVANEEQGAIQEFFSPITGGVVGVFEGGRTYLVDSYKWTADLIKENTIKFYIILVVFILSLLGYIGRENKWF